MAETDILKTVINCHILVKYRPNSILMKLLAIHNRLADWGTKLKTQNYKSQYGGRTYNIGY